MIIWYFHLFMNFPQFFVIHTFKGFIVVNEAEVDISPANLDSSLYFIQCGIFHDVLCIEFN